jgi:predicted nucleic acid-binding protein
MSQILLDTNIALRLLDRNAQEHPVCVQAIKNLLCRGSKPCLAPQVLIEFWVVATRPVNVNGFGWSAAQALDAINHLRGLFLLLDDTPAIFEAWLALVSSDVYGKRAHDAKLVAFMQVHGIREILTLNGADFKDFPVVVVHPDKVV